MAVKAEEIRKAKKFLENKNLSISIIKPRLFAQASVELNKNFNDTLRFIKNKIYGTTNNSNQKKD
jgi:hypothetical protein|tara:strand:+ start:353 stop:547 length:195 start_codon:yes stop_codon:yes gene_type:complete